MPPNGPRLSDATSRMRRLPWGAAAGGRVGASLPPTNASGRDAAPPGKDAIRPWNDATPPGRDGIPFRKDAVPSRNDATISGNGGGTPTNGGPSFWTAPGPPRGDGSEKSPTKGLGCRTRHLQHPLFGTLSGGAARVVGEVLPGRGGTPLARAARRGLLAWGILPSARPTSLRTGVGHRERCFSPLQRS